MKRTAPAPLSVWRTLNHSRFLLGAPHYPEHVDETYWQRDAERLAAAGANTVRMGEFAWHLWEPYEGKFDFDYCITYFHYADCIWGKFRVPARTT